MDETNFSTKYFQNRNVSVDFYKDYRLPSFLRRSLPQDRDSRILDIGCGLGQTLLELNKMGYKHIKGIDITSEAIECVVGYGIEAELIEDIQSYCNTCEQYDFILMSHVLEHIKKDQIINTLLSIRNKILDIEGSLLVVVPNAQSNTGAYWAYEDFTHTTMFTSGSILYVLKAAGFKNIKFLDTLGVDDASRFMKIVKLFLLGIYKYNKMFWNKITASSYHRPSPIIYTFDLKVLASNC